MPDDNTYTYALRNAKRTKYEKKEANFYRRQETQLTEFQNTVLKQDEILLNAELSEMTEEQKRDFYQQEYDNRLVGNKKDSKDREAKNLKKKSRSLAGSAQKRTAQLYRKIDAMAGKMATEENLDLNNITLERLQSYTPSQEQIKADKAIVKKLSTLKKTAGPIYQRFIKLENLYINMLQGETQNKSLQTLVGKQLQIASEEWKEVNRKIDAICVSSQTISDEKASKIKEEQNLTLVQADTYSYIKPGEYESHFENEQTEDDMKDEINQSIKKHIIDWSINEDAVREKMNQMRDEIENAKHQAVSEEEKRKIAYKEKELKDYSVELHVRSQVKRIIDQAKEKNPPEILTPQQIEKTVTTYLKKIVDNAELRFRASPGGVLKIGQGRSVCSNSPDYNAMNAQMYMPYTANKVDQKGNPTYIFRGNLTYGYLGGNNAREYVGQGDSTKDNLIMYGSVSMKLNKEKMKKRTAFVVGNSLHHYDILMGRNLTDPDMLCAGDNLATMYNRAKEVEKNNWKMDSAEQEAQQIVSSDGGTMRYFEAHYLGRISAREIDEYTYTLKDPMPKTKEELKELLNSNPEVRKVYDLVQTINRFPAQYGRENGDPKVKFTVWDNNGNTLSAEDVDFIFK